MHYKLIVSAFEKVKEDLKKESGVTPSETSCAKRLSFIILEENNFPYGEKSLYNLRKLTLNESKSKLKIKQPEVVNALCKFLGYKDYKDYLINSSLPDNEIGDKIEPKKYFWAKIITSLVFIIFLYLYINKPRFMIWQEDHYVEVPFDTSKYNIGQLKHYKEERILNFKRIFPECDSTIFFNNDKAVNLWYGKNTKGKIEYFTDLGTHPETGKTLKAITTYIIEKYICIEE